MVSEIDKVFRLLRDASSRSLRYASLLKKNVSDDTCKELNRLGYSTELVEKDKIVKITW